MPATSSLVHYSAYGGTTRPAHDRLIEHLRSIGLIGEPCGAACYLSGPRFFNHITFLGCAPSLILDPAEGEDYLRLEIPALSKPILHAGSSSRAPLCPECRNPIDNWKTQLAEAKHGKVSCATCSSSHPVARLNLRKRACYSDCIVRIRPVFESEAVPGNELLAGLERDLGAHFGYAYINASS